MVNLALARSHDKPQNRDLDTLVVKLDHYIRRSERLALINQLHGRLASAIDVPSMIEAFSVWLMPLFEHNLLAYDNPARGRSHLFCSCHGPKRNAVTALAKSVFSSLSHENHEKFREDRDYQISLWPLAGPGGSGNLLLLHQKEKIDPGEAQLMDEALSVLHEPLRRALDYEDLFDQARKDALTGLSNRRVFEDRIHPLMDSALRHGYPLSLASMDLDGFKQINDTLGHAEGDAVLRRVAGTLGLLIRGCDLLVRMGGDEFMLVLPDTTLQDARKLAVRLRKAVSDLDVKSAHGERLGISIGLARWEKALTLEQWLERADASLYRAKAAGRKQIADRSGGGQVFADSPRGCNGS